VGESNSNGNAKLLAIQNLERAPFFFFLLLRNTSLNENMHKKSVEREAM
jgi:hypothetical protein